jgi:hypothetical protein
LRLAVFFPILSPFRVVGRSLEAKGLVAHDRASNGNEQKERLAGFRQDVLIGSIFGKAPWARAPYVLVTSLGREGSALMALPAAALPASQRETRRPQDRRSSMKTFLRVAVLAIAFLPLAGLQAQAQGSNQAGDDALNWAAVGGRGGGAYGGAYARYGYSNGRHYHRRHWR